ncbi:endo-beta-N-acetylglucosaminidase, partial [Brachybacterium sp.]|uniref:endo-beta-N-acetylglucosaminidase n=1 Tax=Brachybacterium sp. TaxID=1891286 RepID=UPI002ED00EE4
MPSSPRRTRTIPPIRPSRRQLFVGAATVTGMGVAAASVTAPVAVASDTLPWEGELAPGPHQPAQRAYNPDQVLAWDPSTDPDAAFLRSRVPLQPRASALAAAQRHPQLPAETRSLVLAGDYGNAFFESHPYTDVFSQHLFEYWQYADVYASWHGMAAQGTPPELYRPEEEWTQRWFEFGAVNLPNPGYTDAAHRNGVLSLGNVFFSDNDRGSQTYSELLVRDEDGSFPAVTQLVRIAEYFGFDGYFINQEQVSVSMTREQITTYREFLVALRDAGMYVQWYDSVTDEGTIDYQNEFNAANSPWVINDEQGRVSDSIFLNYWWNRDMLADSAAHAQDVGLDPREAVFVGVEAGMYQFEQPYDLRDNFDEDGVPRNAVASLGTDFTHADFEAKTDVDRQHETYDRARRWWTGTEDGAGSPAEDAWPGMDASIVERSPLTGTRFHTRFSTGHGLGYWREGEQVSSVQWGNIGIQDVPVTWQWWFEGDGDLRADHDYGPEAVAAPRFTYTPLGAFDGGSSLVIEGTLEGDARLRLFRSELEITDSTQLHLTVQIPRGAVELSAALTLASDPAIVLELPLTLEDGDGWVRASVDLGDLAGDTILGLGVALHTDEEQEMQVNLGTLAVAPAATKAPKRPRHFTITQALPATQELTLGWTLDGFDSVSRYEVSVDGEHLGAIYGDVLYVKDFAGRSGTFSLEAVGHDGQRSRPATLDLDLAGGPGAVQASANGAAVTVTWDAPASPGTAVTIEALDAGDSPFRTKVIADKGATSATLEGTPTDGSRFRATVDDRHATPVSALGTFTDTELAPYPAEFAEFDGTTLVLRRPTPNDWSTLTVLEDG